MSDPTIYRIECARDGRPHTRTDSGHGGDCFVPDPRLQDIADALEEVEWCFINGVPRWADPDWDRHQAADDQSDSGRHGAMYMSSNDSLAALTQEDNDE